MFGTKIIVRKIVWSAAFVGLLSFFSCASGSGARAGEGFSLEEELARKTAEQLAGDDFFMPERYEEIPSGQTSATFKTSVPKAALYVNGEYHGLTPLKATGLVPGRYAVQIKREGYKTVNVTIQVKDGISDFYYIELEIDDAPAAAAARELSAPEQSLEAREP